MGDRSGGGLGGGPQRGPQAGDTGAPVAGTENPFSGKGNAGIGWDPKADPTRDPITGDRVGGGGGRGGPSSTPTADVKPPPGAVPGAPVEQTNFLDSILGYDSIQQRRAAYQGNPNRPGYDTSTMGIPINVPISEMISPTVFGNPVVDTLFNAGLTAIGATPISAGLAMTKGIQSATGMSGGPAPGGFQDNLGARQRTDAGPGDGQTGVARKAVAGAETNPTSATAPAGADQAQAEAPMVNPELAAILAENRRLASRRKTIMTGDIGAAQTTRKTVLGM